MFFRKFQRYLDGCASEKWTIGRRLIRLLYPTELWQMVGCKVGNKTGARMETSESETYWGSERVRIQLWISSMISEISTTTIQKHRVSQDRWMHR